MTDDTPTPHDEASMLAAEYVLGLLPAAERQAFANRLGGEPRLVEAVRYWEEHFVQMADVVEPVAPAREVFNKIERASSPSPPELAPRYGTALLSGAVSQPLPSSASWLWAPGTCARLHMWKAKPW